MTLDHPSLYKRFQREIAAHTNTFDVATTHWKDRCTQISIDAQNGSPFNFLRWPSFSDFSVPEDWIPTSYYESLRAQPDWASRWFSLTRETKIGNPQDYSLDLGTSPILVQHAYHLMRYEQITNRTLTDCDVVFEVGGGYGSFCRLLKNAGFAGLHMIYDLPHVSSTQQLYLGLSGFDEVSFESIGNRAKHAFCLLTDAHLDAAYDFFVHNEGLRVVFVATWSLSEMPLNVRDRIFPRFDRFYTNYLMAYQPFWEIIDNGQYFESVSRNRPDLKWYSPTMPRVSGPTNVYLFA